ncbi:uncharacterized protein TNCV_45911 [Trichonephila clavipes]|nr:uncharacterized protein TNCV_45911 [Trichonephila clavipes]
MSYSICRFKELGNDGGRPGSGRKRTVNTLRNRKAIEYRVQRDPRLLTEKNKLVRLRRCRKLLRWVASQRWERFLFADEKLFTVEQVHNYQNDRIWSVDAPNTSAIVEHRQYPKSVIVWGGICSSGKTALAVVEESVKINQKAYQRNILEGTSVGPKAFQKCKLDVSKSLHQLTRPKGHKSDARQIFQT